MSERRDLSDTRIVITGASSGIGRAAVRALAARGAQVVLAGRSAERTRHVVELIRSEGGEAGQIELDLASLASVRRAAAEILADPRPIHTLINNAGVAGRGGLTEDGFEWAFGVNHLGHFLLTGLLLDRLIASAPSRIVSVSSEMHRDVQTFEWDLLTKPAGVRLLRAYRYSKLANVLFVRHLATHLAATQVTAVAVHPGLVASEIWRRVPQPIRRPMARRMLTAEQGAEPVLNAAVAPDVRSGAYYARLRPRDPSPLVQDALAGELWRRCLDWVASEEGDGHLYDVI